MKAKNILNDAINKHNLSTLKDFKNQEELLALIRYTSHIAHNEACTVKPKKYYSDNIHGNHHDVVIWMNKFHPNGELIDIQTVNSSLRVVVWRE